MLRPAMSFGAFWPAASRKVSGTGATTSKFNLLLAWLSQVSVLVFSAAASCPSEHPLAMTAALSDVMWASRNDDPTDRWYHG